MTAGRLIDDISSNPGGVTGTQWTQDAGDSIEALWALNGGVLTSVSGTNAISGIVYTPAGFSSVSEGFRIAFVPAATNTGAMTVALKTDASTTITTKSLLDPDGDALTAGSVVSGRLTTAVFYTADDALRLETSGGTTNVTVEGGLTLQKSSPARLAAAAGPSTSLTSIGTVNFQCTNAASRVVISGNVSRVVGAGSADVDGAVIALYVDGVSQETFTDHVEPSQHHSTPFEFVYEPGDITSHSYEVRASSTISATYPKDANWLGCEEWSQNS